MPDTPKKILVVRFSSIGDIVLSSPVLRCLHEQLGAELHYLTKRSFAGLVQHNPHVAKVWAMDKALGELLPQLRAERYDAIVDLHHNLRTWHLALALRRPVYRFDKMLWRRWRLLRWRQGHLPHIVERYFTAVRRLGVRNDGRGLDHYLPADLSVPDAKAWLGGPFTAFVIGAAHATKRLPQEQIVATCRLIAGPVLLLGGPAEAEAGAAIAQAAGPHVHNACGQFDLAQSAGLLRQARKVISHDTGLMHMAAAFRQDIVSLWGSTHPVLGYTPYYPEGEQKGTFLKKDLACQPCSKMGRHRCPKGHFNCMALLRPADIANAANAE